MKNIDSNFRRWFGDYDDPDMFTSKYKGSNWSSQIINSDNSPQIVYHATEKDFKTFATGLKTSNANVFGSWETTRHAIFVTPDKQFAQEFITNSDTGTPREGSRVIPLYISMKSPLNFVSKDIYDISEEFREVGINPRWISSIQNIWELFDDEDGKGFVDACKKLEYDGVIFLENNRKGDSVLVYAVFNSNQLKSAIGNRGDYDMNKNNIDEEKEKQYISSLLQEGKKQALAILSFLPSEEVRKEIVDRLMFIDPTSSKKYVEVFAKIMKSWFADGMSSGIMYDRLKHNIAPKIIEAESRGFNKDISKISDYETLDEILTKEINRITRSSIKKGVGGLSPNDYAVVYESDNTFGLMPFSWEASKILASNYVGKCSGKWCIAYQKTDDYWNSIVVSEGQAPVYIFSHPDEESREAEKYAFMFSEEHYEIWDEEDNRLHNTKVVIDRLGLTTDEVNEIWDKARNLAEEHIPNFGEGENKVIETIYTYQVEKFEDSYNIFFNIVNQEGSGEDFSTVFYKEGTAYARTGISFFSSKLGKNLLLGIAEEHDLSELPDLINDTLVVTYQPNSYSSSLQKLSNSIEDLGDIIPNFDFHAIKYLKDFSSVLFINASSVDDFDLSKEPLIERVLERNYKRAGSYDFIDVGWFTLEWCTYNISYTMKDAVESIPNLKKFIYDETGWERDDTIEAGHGQKFLDY